MGYPGAMRRSALLFLSFFPVLAACSNGTTDESAPPPSPRPWQRLATPTSAAMAEVRGLRPVRGILHSHSPYSHDACDGDGVQPGGGINVGCAQDLRRSVCDAAEDFVFLTDHADHMAEYDFESLLFIEAGDEPVKDAGGAVIANRIGCGDGRTVLITAGNENSLMSVGLERHVPGTAAERRAIYEGDDAATVEAMRAAGALVMIPHTEQRSLEYLAATSFDGMEIYNLHAAIDPDIRRDSLGLDSYAAAASILPFTKFDPEGPEPDLTLLGFFEDLPAYAERWDSILPVRHVTGIAGTDVHQNTFPSMMRDGERGDSYRRLMRWFSNIVLLGGELTPGALKEALKAGRSYVAFEILGVPVGFDFHAEQGGSTIEMGGRTTAGGTLVARAPAVLDPDPAATPPAITMRLYRVTAGKTETAAEGLSVDLTDAAPGAYRVEVRITPHHLRPYLGYDADRYIRDSLWVISNPIYVD
jgi:hypothetical protein